MVYTDSGYRLISPEKIEIIEIWGIGKREKEEIYRIIGKRIRGSRSLKQT